MIAMTVIVCALHLVAAQYVPAQRSKGDMVRFRRADIKRRISSDSENAVPLAFPKDTGTGYQSHGSPNNEVRNGGKIEVENLAIQEQASIFHWKDLCYEVKVGDGTKKILNSIDGWVKPGTLTALMVLPIPI